MNLARLLRKRPWGTAGVAILFVVVVVAIFAPLIAPYNFNDISVKDRLQPPGENHILGTDNLGRDVFSRLIFGARPYVLSAVIAVGISLILGFLLAIIVTTSKSNDLWLRILLSTLAGIVVALVFTIVLWFGQPLFITIRSLNMSSIILFASMLVSFFLLPSIYYSIRLAIASKFSRNSLVHIFSTAIVGFGISIGLTLAVIVPLGYIGLGIAPPAPEWGGTLSGIGRSYALSAPWTGTYTNIAIIVTGIGTILFGIATFEFWFPKIKGYQIKINNPTTTSN